MKAKLWIAFTCLAMVAYLLVSCTTDESGILVGTWLANDMEDRLIFRDDGTFTSETDNAGTWEEFLSGTYTYAQDVNQLTFTSNGSDIVQNLILNGAQDTLGIALDAFLGGDTATLLGTWTSTQTVSTLTVTREWVFTASTVSYTVTTSTPPATDTDTGTVSINAVVGTFTITSSSDPADLPNDTYDYIVLGDGVVITDPNDMDITYYLKQ
jgi:hypothetical protein